MVIYAGEVEKCENARIGAKKCDKAPFLLDVTHIAAAGVPRRPFGGF